MKQIYYDLRGCVLTFTDMSVLLFNHTYNKILESDWLSPAMI